MLSKQDKYVKHMLEAVGPAKASHAVRVPDKSGWTPLHYAAHVGSGMEALFTSNPDVDALDEYVPSPVL